MRLLDQPDDLFLVGCGISRASSPPSPIMLYGMARPSLRRLGSPEGKQEEGLDMRIAVLGVDLGKNVCSLVGSTRQARLFCGGAPSARR
jgi:hypothetical protein